MAKHPLTKMKRPNRSAMWVATGMVALLINLAFGLVPCWAIDVIIKDGDTIELGGTSLRLDGIDAPELDQVCLDEKGAVWACGIEARDQLAALIRDRAVRCDDKGPDPVYPTRRIGACWVEGDDLNLSQRLVREGWALNFEPSVNYRSQSDHDVAHERATAVSVTAASQQLHTCCAATRERPDYWVHSSQATLAIFFSRITPLCHPAARSRGRLHFAQRSRATAASTTSRVVAVIGIQ